MSFDVRKDEAIKNTWKKLSPVIRWVFVSGVIAVFLLLYLFGN